MPNMNVNFVEKHQIKLCWIITLKQSKISLPKSESEKFGTRVNTVKLAGHGASVENGPTTMKLESTKEILIFLNMYCGSL